MDLNEYQKNAIKTAVYPGQGTIWGFNYTVLGLCGETGEVSEKLKKIFSDHDGILTEQHRNAFLKELGDILWYVANSANELGFTLEEVGVTNNIKLDDRHKRGKLQGSGDER